MLSLVYSTQFKKDFKKARKLPIEDLSVLFSVISTLEKQETLHVKYKDHELVGNWSGFRECHVKPDWLLVYKVVGTELQLARLGSHNALF